MNRSLAIICLTVVVFLGSVGMPLGADREKGWAAFKRGDYETVKREPMPLAIRGHPKSQSIIGHMYMGGWDGKKNVREGIEWIKLAAKGGVFDAQKYLARSYEK